MVKLQTYAYIDAANLHSAMKSLDWKLDYARFRQWLRDKYSVERAYLFIGHIPEYQDLYTRFRGSGFTLAFKEVVYDRDGKPKGNCDADLVLQAAQDAYEGNCKQALIVSSDGDYAGLARFLLSRGQLRGILSPSVPEKCSVLLKRTGASIAYICDQRSLLEKVLK